MTDGILNPAQSLLQKLGVTIFAAREMIAHGECVAQLGEAESKEGPLVAIVISNGAGHISVTLYANEAIQAEGFAMFSPPVAEWSVADSEVSEDEFCQRFGPVVTELQKGCCWRLVANHAVGDGATLSVAELGVAEGGNESAFLA